MKDGCNFCLGNPLDNPELFPKEDDPFIKENYFYYDDYGRGWRAFKINFCPICGRSLTDKAAQMVMEALNYENDKGKSNCTN